jgi:transcriptional regulator with XRE-family HTH domain
MLQVVQHLRELRSRSGVSQRALAARLGIAESTIAMRETGRAEPPVTALLEWGRALGVEIDLVVRDPKEDGEVELTDVQQRALEATARCIADVPDDKVPVLLAVLDGLRRSE